MRPGSGLAPGAPATPPLAPRRPLGLRRCGRDAGGGRRRRRGWRRARRRRDGRDRRRRRRARRGLRAAGEHLLGLAAHVPVRREPVLTLELHHGGGGLVAEVAGLRQAEQPLHGLDLRSADAEEQLLLAERAQVALVAEPGLLAGVLRLAALVDQTGARRLGL